MTFPDGWVVLVPSVAGDATAVARLKADLGAKAAIVDELVGALAQQPGNWFVASRLRDLNVATGQVRTWSGAGSWSNQEQALLTKTYGAVQTVQLSIPQPGTGFTFSNQGSTNTVYAFERDGRVAIFVFAAPGSPVPGPGWADVIGTFRDAGN